MISVRRLRSLLRARAGYLRDTDVLQISSSNYPATMKAMRDGRCVGIIDLWTGKFERDETVEVQAAPGEDRR